MKTIPRVFELTRLEALIVTVLFNTEGIVTKEMFAEHLKAEVNDDLTNRIKVTMCRVRCKLEPNGIYISTIWRRGYVMAPDYKEKLRSKIDEVNSQRYVYDPNVQFVETQT